MSKLTLTERINNYERLMRLDQPAGILLLLWPTLWGLWVAGEGRPSVFLIWLFVLGTVLMRSAGVVMNDYADRRFDPMVARTKNRPLATGVVSEKEALFLAGGLIVSAAFLVWPMHKLVWFLAAGALFLAATYPFTKRFFALPQAYLGVAFGFGIPMAFAAQLYVLPPLTWVMLAANVFWAIAYDTEYAMVDREDDRKIGIKTSAITFGRFDILAVMICYAAMMAIMTWLGWRLGRGVYYYAGLGIAAALIVYQYKLIRNRDRQQCFKAFQHNNWIGAAITVGLIADYTIRGGHYPMWEW